MRPLLGALILAGAAGMAADHPGFSPRARPEPEPEPDPSRATPDPDVRLVVVDGLRLELHAWEIEAIQKAGIAVLEVSAAGLPELTTAEVKRRAQRLAQVVAEAAPRENLAEFAGLPHPVPGGVDLQLGGPERHRADPEKKRKRKARQAAQRRNRRRK